eukprot:1594658-Alexandrium_andersonii.AAC.1
MKHLLSDHRESCIQHGVAVRVQHVRHESHDLGGGGSQFCCVVGDSLGENILGASFVVLVDKAWRPKRAHPAKLPFGVKF